MHYIAGSNAPLRLNASSMRDSTERWLLASISRRTRRPALRHRLVPASANPAGLEGLPELDQAARVGFNRK